MIKYWIAFSASLIGPILCLYLLVFGGTFESKMLILYLFGYVHLVSAWVGNGLGGNETHVSKPEHQLVFMALFVVGTVAILIWPTLGEISAGESFYGRVLLVGAFSFGSKTLVELAMVKPTDFSHKLPPMHAEVK